MEIKETGLECCPRDDNGGGGGEETPSEPESSGGDDEDGEKGEVTPYPHSPSAEDFPSLGR
jgi:hypothetical protein